MSGLPKPDQMTAIAEAVSSAMPEGVSFILIFSTDISEKTAEFVLTTDMPHADVLHTLNSAMKAGNNIINQSN